MFVGHFALALGSKREAPTVSLGWFIAAVTVLPPPPAYARPLGLFALIGWLVVPWFALADRYYTTDRSVSDTRPGA